MEAITLIELPGVGIFEMAPVFGRAFLMDKSLIYQKPMDGGGGDSLMGRYVARQFQLPGDGSRRAGGVFFLKGNDQFGQLWREDPALTLIRAIPGTGSFKTTLAIPAGYPLCGWHCLRVAGAILFREL